MDNDGINTIENTSTGLGRKKIVIFSAFFFILVGGIVAVLLLSKVRTTAPIIVGRTYNDQGKYFTIQIPKNWNASENTAQGTTGIGTPDEATQDIEETQIGDQSGTGIAIQVYKGTPTCPLNQPMNTTIAGFPASYDSSNDTWTIPTTKALITITVSYPGSSAIRHPMLQSAPTPVPANIAEKDKNMVMDALKTLKLQNLTTFSC